MYLRGEVFLGVLAFAVFAGGAAIWQTFELRSTDKALASVSQSTAGLRRELKAATESAQAAARRAGLAEKDLESLKLTIPADAAGLDGLRAELAATRQQLTAAETAMTEAETQLSREITAHTALKAKAAELTQSLANAERKIAEQQTVSNADGRQPIVTGSVSKSASDEPPKQTVTIERVPEKKVSSKPVAKRPAKTAKHPEPSSIFSPFF